MLPFSMQFHFLFRRKTPAIIRTIQTFASSVISILALMTIQLERVSADEKCITLRTFICTILPVMFFQGAFMNKFPVAQLTLIRFRLIDKMSCFMPFMPFQLERVEERGFTF